MTTPNQDRDRLEGLFNQLRLSSVGTTHTDTTIATNNGVEPAPAASGQSAGGFEGGTKGLVDIMAEFRLARDAENAQVEQENEELRQVHQVIIQKEFNRKRVKPAILEQMRALPIFAEKDRIVETIKNHQMVLVMGETGSGKSTQIPQYLVEAGFAEKGQIGITQPRRVAAKSLAQRVSVECGVKLGSLVGYSVRFDQTLSENTIIKYMTDGLLVKEFSQSPQLDKYSVIIIDEAHERSIHTDVCFGLLKRAAKSRPDLRIIISSATLEEDKFSKYFNNAPVIKVRGKTYPVELVYEPRGHYADYVQTAVDTILKIHSREPKGDVLVFLTGQDEIDSAWDRLESGMAVRGIPSSDLLIVPCCGALPFEEQQKIFEETPVGSRKIVLATNIAETSLTIDGIVYVVDCGFYKQNQYNSRTGIDSLIKMPITKFQAIQRMGRAGRTRPGKCYRLYTEYAFESEFKETPIPEIKRCNVQSVILDLIGMGVSDPLQFEFMDAPDEEATKEALDHLQELEALDASFCLTRLGKQMSEFPLDPPLAKVLIVSATEGLGCSSEVLMIVALLSTQFHNLFNRSKKKRQQSDVKKASFNQPEGDHLTLLRIYKEWRANYYSDDWCRSNFINFRHLKEAEEIRVQLKSILLSHELQERSCGQMTSRIQKAFTAGFFRRLAKKRFKRHSYDAVTLTTDYSNSDLFLHPSSALFRKVPEPSWIIFHEVVRTTKAYIRGAIVVEPQWVIEQAPVFAAKINSMRGSMF